MPGRLVASATRLGHPSNAPTVQTFGGSDARVAAAYLLDCGLGVTNQFARTGIPFTAVRSILITHHHPDHNIEYGPFLLLGWVQGLPSSVRAFGPPPLKQMTQDFPRQSVSKITWRT